ncbi:MAG: hypothetical protein JSV22_13880 [Bacteroidales bacterium]|nr:MAG: hypothetical protein JSV22_13880 [Bacteroidales bacterium]
MSNKLARIISISLYVLMAVSVVFALLFYMGNKVPGTEGTAFEEPKITENMMIWAYILFGIAAIAAIIFPLINLIKNPLNAKNFLIVLLIFIVIVGISYLTASSEPISFLKVDATEKTLKMVDTGLKVGWIFAAIAFVGILFYEIASIFR